MEVNVDKIIFLGRVLASVACLLTLVTVGQRALPNASG